MLQTAKILRKRHGQKLQKFSSKWRLNWKKLEYCSYFSNYKPKPTTMQLSKGSFLILPAIICFVIQANAQVKVFEKNQSEKIQNGHTHILVNKLDFPQSDEFISVFKKYWTLTKGVDFIEI